MLTLTPMISHIEAFPQDISDKGGSIQGHPLCPMKNLIQDSLPRMAPDETSLAGRNSDDSLNLPEFDQEVLV
jgi:hypothetical protein